MTTEIPIAASFLSVLIYQTALFAVALLWKDNFVADIGWGPGFILVWAVTFFLGPAGTPLQLLSGARAAAGAVIWLAGFIFESVGDLQLGRFEKDPGNRGRIMTRGLWRYTRHPNYFGESLVWWGLFVVGLSVAGGWAGRVSPLIMTPLLTRVSGIPLLEKKYRGNKEFEGYARRTNAFVPGPPKREEGGFS